MRRTVATILTALALAALPVMAKSNASRLTITNLTTEYEHEPLAISASRPRFSWQLQTDERNTRQTAYHITVTDENGHEVWNTGRISSGASLNIPYGGGSLKAETRYTWTVTVWDSNARSASCTSWFETALADWSQAQWIGGNNAMPFFSQYLPVFRIRYSVQGTTPSQRIGFIYGANDMRLGDINKNVLGMSSARNGSYIKLEIAADSARLYRAGYRQSDRPHTPIAAFAMPHGTDITLRHEVIISSSAGSTAISIDGKEIGRAELNPAGRGGDFTAFPVVGDIGYDVTDGTTATFGDVSIENYRSPHNKLSGMSFGTVSGCAVIHPDETGATMLRTTFRAYGKPRKARLYATARGIYDFYINGQRISDDFFAPGLTQYNKTHFYQTYDVTAMLKEGDNAAGAILNEGWWSGGISFEPANWNWFGDRQALMACLKIWYDDGSSQVITTTPQQWQASNGGPVRYGSLFQGEVYDARMEQAGWATAGYDARGWEHACKVRLEETVSDKPVNDWPLANDYSQWRLVPQTGKPVREYSRLTAQTMEQPRRGVYLYDMGQNFAGVPRLTFRGLRAGQKVVARFAEVRYPDLPKYKGNEGMAMLENIRAAMAQDIYIAKGDSVETFCPRSTYHGYRYVELTGLDAPLPTHDVQALVLSTVDAFTADYQSSDSLLNRLVSNVKYSTLSNVFSVPTDCPQRNERMGWSGDVSVFAPAMSFLFNADRFLHRHVQALCDTQTGDGAFPPIAPCGGGFGGPLWQSAGIILPWQNYIQYGDTATMAAAYPAMRRYIDMVMSKYIDPADRHFKGTETWVDLGDWLGPQNAQNDNTMLFDCYLAYELRLMARMAAILGHDGDAATYSRLSQERRDFINRHYIDPQTAQTTGSGLGRRQSSWTGTIGSLPKDHIVGTHTSYAVALALGIVDDSQRGAFSDNLLRAVVSPAKGDDKREYPPYSLMTGFVGTPWISYALSDNGNADAAYRLLLNRQYPSWLYPVTQGATTIWERLNSYTHQDGFGNNNNMNSFNHYAFGCVFDWLMQRSAGISRDTAAPAFRHFILRPTPDPTGGLTRAHAHYDSMYGRIESGWSRANGCTTYTFRIPANTSATLMLPLEKGQRIKSADGMRIKKKDGKINCRLGSGSYKLVISDSADKAKKH